MDDGLVDSPKVVDVSVDDCVQEDNNNEFDSDYDRSWYPSTALAASLSKTALHLGHNITSELFHLHLLRKSINSSSAFGNTACSFPSYSFKVISCFIPSAYIKPSNFLVEDLSFFGGSIQPKLEMKS